MNDIFLAGVANARIFRGNDMFATAKTLVDSSITIGVSAEDIRAGKGAKLYGKYFHTSTFDLKMTDAMFKLEYIQANIGAEMQLGGDVFTEIECKASEIASKITDAKPMISGSETIYVYLKKTNEDKWETYTVEEASALTGDDMYCVQFLNTNDNARKIIVNANFTPDTLSVYLDADLFAGDSMNPTTGTKVGTVTIKIPRFLLSGSQEIAMNMTGAAQTPFEGSALASNAEGCEGNGIYAEIVEVNTNFNWKNYVVKIMVDGGIEALRAASDVSELNIYALMGGFYAPKKMNSDEFEILTSVDNEVLLIDNGRYLLSENSILLQHKENANWNYGQIVIVPESQTVSSVGDNPIYLSAIDNPITQISDIEMGVCKTRGSTIWASSFNSEINDNIIYDLENIDTIYTCQNATILNNNEEFLTLIEGVDFGNNRRGNFYQSVIKNKTPFKCYGDFSSYLFNETVFDYPCLYIEASNQAIIYSHAFISNNLTEIQFMYSVEMLSSDIFVDCDNLNLINLQGNSYDSEMEEYAPWGATNATILWGMPDYIRNVIFDDEQGTLTIVGKQEEDCPLSKNIVDKIWIQYSSISEVVLQEITSIGANAFAGHSDLDTIIIPNSVKSIGSNAFNGCRNLSIIRIPNSVTSIGSAAFNGCRSLEEIEVPITTEHFGSIFGKTYYSGSYEADEYYIPSSLIVVIINNGTEIGNYAFWGCSSLTSVTIPDGVTSIGDHAFSYCSGLTSITIPNSVESIGNYAFDSCSGLTSITIPNSVTTIGNSVFEFCSSLTSVTIPDSVTSIGNSAFEECSILTSVTIPDSVTSIGKRAFCGCTGLTSIIIGSGVTSIGSTAFDGCSSLTSITIDNVEGSISGSPWGADNATITWLR